MENDVTFEHPQQLFFTLCLINCVCSGVICGCSWDLDYSDYLMFAVFVTV